MSDQPDSRFITREEHDGIVDFYKKVIAHQHSVTRRLRDQLADLEVEKSLMSSQPVEALASPDFFAFCDNVVALRPRTPR